MATDFVDTEEFERDGDLGDAGTLRFETPEQIREREEKIEALKQKIMKMLARGKDKQGASDAERETAMAMAIDAARRNGLDVYAIEAEMNRDDRFIMKKMELLGHGNWHIQLASALTSALIVRYVIHHQATFSDRPNARSGRRMRMPRADYITMVGMPGDLEIVEYLYVYIVRQLEEMANAAYQREKLRCLDALATPPSGKAFRDDFYRGAIATVSKKCEILFKMERDDAANSAEAEAEHEEMMALVPLKEADVQAAQNKFFPKLGKAKGNYWGKPLPKYRHDPEREVQARLAREEAYMQGRKAGHDIDIRKGINGRNTEALPSGK